MGQLSTVKNAVTNYIPILASQCGNSKRATRGLRAEDINERLAQITGPVDRQTKGATEWQFELASNFNVGIWSRMMEMTWTIVITVIK